jgi:hypothetical protein
VADESHEERVNRELIELLNELRVALPGVQVLFAFLLAVPFAQRFGEVTAIQKDAYMVALLAALASTVLLMAPTTFHRIRFRDGDKEQLLRYANVFTIVGTLFIAVGMSAAVFLVTDVIYDDWKATVVTSLAAAFFALVWFVLPLVRKAAD